MMRAMWARVVAAAIVAAAAGAAVYAGTAARSADKSAVRAQRFELVDSQGRVRAALQIAAEPGMARNARRQAPRENPELIVYDPDGKVRLRVPLDQLASALLARPSQIPSIITVLPGEPAIFSGPLAPLSRDEMQRRVRAQLLHQ